MRHIFYKILLLIIFTANAVNCHPNSFFSRIEYIKDTAKSKSEISQKIFTLPSLDYFEPKIAYALSGGGARGLSHIGAIKELESAGIQPSFVAGTSIGAILGGLYSCGYSPKELDSVARGMNWNEIMNRVSDKERSDLFIDQKLEIDRSIITLNLKNFRLVSPDGISLGNKLGGTLQSLIWNSIYNGSNDFNNLKYQYRAIATDVVRGAPIAFSKGNIAMAMKASATFPLRYSPVRIDSLILVDGGLFANLPTKAAKEFKPDYIIGFNAISPIATKDNINSVWTLADQIVSILMKTHSDESLKECNTLITPNMGDISNQDFNKIDTLLFMGKVAGKSAVDKILSDCAKIKQEKLAQYFNDNFPKQYQNQFALKTNNFSKLDSFELLSFTAYPAQIVNKLSSLSDAGIYESFDFYRMNDSLLLINANKRRQIKQIDIKGISEIVSLISMDSTLRNYSGALLTETNIAKICENILKKLRFSNYSFATIQKIGYDENNSNLNIDVCEGKVNKIDFIGANHTSPFLIERELKFKIGEPLSSKGILESWTNLINCGLFDDVSVEIEHAGDGVAINIIFVESTLQALKIGARVDNERKFQAGMDFIQENIFNIGLRLNARLLGGERNWTTSVEIQNPQIYNTYWYFKANTYWNYRDFWNYKINEDGYNKSKDFEFTEEIFGTSVSVGRQIERLGALNFTIKREWQRLYSDSKNKGGYKPLTTLKNSFVFDNEDRVEFARSGRYFDLSYESTFLETFSSNSFSKVEIKYRENFSIKRFTFTPSFIFGFADATIPQTEYFELGGQNSFFGMRDEEERDKQITLGSISMRYRSPTKILFDTYFTFRYDIGSTWSALDDMKVSKMKHGFGGSVSIDTPIGAASFSVGKAMRFVDSKAKWLNSFFYFSIGAKL